MDSTLLVEEQIDAGGQLLQALDSSHDLDVLSALWWLEVEASEWRLVLATPEVDRNGPRGAYELVGFHLTVTGLNRILSLRYVTVLSPHAPLITALAKDLPTGRHVRPLHVQNSTLGGVFVAEAWIYRLGPPNGEAAAARRSSRKSGTGALPGH